MNEGQIPIESEFNELNISDEVLNSASANHENCYQPKKRKFWCKECVPSCIIEGWTSGNSEIDEFIKDTIYNPGYSLYYDDYHPLFLEWVAFDRFENVKQIGEGGFAKVYSAKWIDGQAIYSKQDNGSWKKSKPEPMYVALKRLNGSQNMSAEYLNEVIYYNSILFNYKYFYINYLNFNVKNSLKYIGMSALTMILVYNFME